MMKLGMLLNRLICDTHAKFRVSSFKNVVTITADTHAQTHTHVQVDRIRRSQGLPDSRRPPGFQ